MAAIDVIQETDQAQDRKCVSGLKMVCSGNRSSRFEVFRTDRVSLTSTLYAGGDWRWRLIGVSGEVLVNSESYASERACRTAVLALQVSAELPSSTRRY